MNEGWSLKTDSKNMLFDTRRLIKINYLAEEIKRYKDKYINNNYSFCLFLRNFSTILKYLIFIIHKNKVIDSKFNDLVHDLIGVLFIRNIDFEKQLKNYLVVLNKKLFKNRYTTMSEENFNREINSIIYEIEKVREKNSKKDCLDGSKITDNETFFHPFLSDYDRITFSSAYRRLQDKTQVFPLEKYDYVRTRLTHSSEVACVASLIGNLIGLGIDPKDSDFKKSNAFRFQSCSMCSALLHDIGNPPFGHFGEDIIKNYFKENWDSLEIRDYTKDSKGIDKKPETCKKDDFLKITLVDLFNDLPEHKQMKNDFTCFDGNAQSFRVITKLQNLKDQNGLDLTSAVLAGMIKYPYNSCHGQKKEKFGYFYSEEEEIKILGSIGTYIELKRNPISLIVEAADDICYLTSDFDDAVKKGVITYEKLISSFKKINSNQYNDPIIWEFKKNFSNYYKENNLIDPHNAFGVTIQRMTIDLKHDMIHEVVKKFIENIGQIFDGIDMQPDDNQKKDKKNLLKNGEIELLAISKYKDLISFIKKEIFIKNVFDFNEILKSELEGNQILTFLLNEFTSSVLNLILTFDNEGNFIIEKSELSGKNTCKHVKVFKLISHNFINVYKNSIKNLDPNDTYKIVYYKLKLVVDYISGMTDSYAKETYNILHGTCL